MNESIRALWRTMADGWARGDATQFASVFASDVDFVNVRGEALVGREAVETGHAQLFATAYRGTTLSAEVTLIRRLSPELSLVHATSEIGPAGVVTHAQAVVRHDGEPTIAAFHNMIPKGPTA
ncbi:SgcJ/EcaC family oxidoreductase [Amycolatopsis sp. NPDC005232]|uniref:SgcJ/EcaC family oxidoreductase n=1 Tax=unclassified Amycolatopsis TaxID=2618356 RepID=UPI001C6A283D|nr:SgcJ/EcaC family oxidoreductase [Amycolatopsis sp. DSM 110486]QYN23120.1 SgcJ/EcaC family oxidoreductase [Amycolatopsis sp. DSM 110486]